MIRKWAVGVVADSHFGGGAEHHYGELTSADFDHGPGNHEHRIDSRPRYAAAERPRSRFHSMKPIKPLAQLHRRKAFPMGASNGAISNTILAWVAAFWATISKYDESPDTTTHDPQNRRLDANK